MADTRDCPKCESTIGATEEKCPSCGIVIVEFEDAMTTVDEAQKALERKRKKAEPTPEPAPVKKSNLGKLASLGSMLRKGKQ
jgi:hypothetical protein